MWMIFSFPENAGFMSVVFGFQFQMYLILQLVSLNLIQSKGMGVASQRNKREELVRFIMEAETDVLCEREPFRNLNFGFKIDAHNLNKIQSQIAQDSFFPLFLEPLAT